MEERLVEVVAGISGDVMEEEAFGVGEFAVGEEGWEEGEEERRWGVVVERKNGGDLCLGPFEEGEKGFGARVEGFG